MKLIIIILIFSYQSYSQSGSWTQLFPTTSPVATAAMYHSSLSEGEVYVTGGLSVNGTMWKWNNSTKNWVNVGSGNARRYGGMAKMNDSELLIFGGRNNPGAQNTTQTFSNFTNILTVVSPTTLPRYRIGFVLNGVGPNNEVLLYGGDDQSGGSSRREDTWIWDYNNQNWVQKFPPIHPGKSLGSVGTTQNNNEVLVFGGHSGASSVSYLDETWIWDNSSGSWTEYTPTVKPAARNYTMLSKLNDTYSIMYGGEGSSTIYGDTWLWNNNTREWTEIYPPTTPGNRRLGSLNYLSNNKVLFFGGNDGSVNLNDTWIFEFFPPEEEPEEVLYGDPNNGDGNNDGILDSLQSNVVSLIVKDEYVTIEVLGSCDTIYDAAEKIDFNENNYYYVLGQLEFKLPCSNAFVKLYFHGIESLDGFTYRKLFPDGTYKEFDNVTFSTVTIGGNQVAVATLNLVDGGPGDYDGIINGVIYDPGGPALPVSANIPFWDWWWVLVLVTGLVYGYKRFS